METSMRQQQGFTIIELMVTVVILSIVTAFAIPSMRDFIRRSNSTSLSNQLLTGLSLARSEALRSGRRVSICASDDGATCTNNGFDKGYIVFQDNGVPRTKDGTDVIVQVFEKPAGNPIFNQTISAVSFLESGMRESGTGVPVGNCYEFIIADLESARAHVHVNVTGSVRTGKGACA
jgi:type IV fimbrial biogenesis protein FimT